MAASSSSRRGPPVHGGWRPTRTGEASWRTVPKAGWSVSTTAWRARPAGRRSAGGRRGRARWGCPPPCRGSSQWRSSAARTRPRGSATSSSACSRRGGEVEAKRGSSASSGRLDGDGQRGRRTSPWRSRRRSSRRPAGTPGRAPATGARRAGAGRGSNPAVEVPGGRVAQHGDRGVEQADVAVHADPVAARGVQAGEQRDARRPARRRSRRSTGRTWPAGRRARR